MVWEGGTESHTFNRLEEIGVLNVIKLPALTNLKGSIKAVLVGQEPLNFFYKVIKRGGNAYLWPLMLWVSKTWIVILSRPLQQHWIGEPRLQFWEHESLESSNLAWLETTTCRAASTGSFKVRPSTTYISSWWQPTIRWKKWASRSADLSFQYMTKSGTTYFYFKSIFIS